MPLSRFFPCFQFRLEDNINKLDYSNNIFTDGFPHVWHYERTLEELNVASTRTNYLPPELFYCQGLKIFLANNNNLENIPEGIGSLRQLQQLNLSRNFISNVPDNIKSCKSLTHLDLSCNSLQRLPDAITCLISLQELILNETYLEFLPANFGRLVNLRIVELRSNNLVSLPKSMQRLANLQRLDIGCNEFTQIPDVIGELKQLREFWFDFNQIQCLPKQIGKLRELEHCEANGNCLNYLPNEIGNCFNVEVFSLSVNNLTTLPFNVGMMKSLVTLKCEANELTELPSCISNLENLEELVVSHNKLVSLPNTLGMLRKLRYLFADDNNLQKLPDEICSCCLLSVVSVSKNKLTALPDNLGHLTNLKVLNIVQNNIVTLPVSILSLVNLTSLWISNNQSQPLIPLQYIEISNKTHLTCFMLPQQKAESLNSCSSKACKNPTEIEHHRGKTAECSISKRRICFAEEAIILHTDQQATHSSLLAYSDNGNYSPLSNIDNSSGSKASTDFSVNAETKDESIPSKDYLMRSPTPYPKELRLMAKYVQLNQQRSLNFCNNGNYEDYASVSLLENPIETLQPENNKSYNKYISHDNSNIPNEDNCYSMEINNANLEHYSNQGSNHNIDKIETTSRKIRVESTVNSRDKKVVEHISPKPPPYHIARCFTKKSAEDLTKYDFTRKQQEDRHIDKYNLNHPICTNSLQQKSEETPNENIYLEYKNEQKQELKKYNTVIKRSGGTDAEITIRENENIDHTDTIERSYTLANKKCTKSRTKWLFGAHKNPRVIQVNVNWENGPDFEIDVSPNKEGIYVISTVSESNASQLIHPLDKLLEVEGIDFTNININDARQVLKISRPSISIMLSRK